MSGELKSNKRIDDLFKKGQEDGLDDREKAELLFLLKAAGVKVVRLTASIEEEMPEKGNVH